MAEFKERNAKLIEIVSDEADLIAYNLKVLQEDEVKNTIHLLYKTKAQFFAFKPSFTGLITFDFLLGMALRDDERKDQDYVLIS